MATMTRSTYDLDVGDDIDWLTLAACRNHDPEWWSVPNPRNRTAKAICGGCPVKRQCQIRAEKLGISGMIVAGKSVKLAPIAPLGTWARCAHAACGRPFWKAYSQQRFCGDPCRFVERNRRSARRAHGR